MHDVEPWKIWACTGVLLALLTTGTSARLHANESGAGLLSQWERYGEGVPAESPPASSSILTCERLAPDDVDYAPYVSGFSFGLHNYSLPITPMAILSHQLIMPRHPIFEDATYPEDNILPDPAVQVASSFPIATPEASEAAAATDGNLDSDLTIDLATINVTKLSKTGEIDEPDAEQELAVNDAAGSYTRFYSLVGNGDQVNIPPVMDAYIALDTSEPIDGLVQFINGPAPNELGEEGMQAQAEETVARQVVLAAAAQQAQAEADMVNEDLTERESNQGNLALLQIEQLRYEQAQLEQENVNLARRVQDELAVRQSGARVQAELRTGIAGAVPYY
jgi:hypothetical protein